MTKKNKLELIAITPEMSKEEITLNLLKMFERQGIKVKGKKFVAPVTPPYPDAIINPVLTCFKYHEFC